MRIIDLGSRVLLGVFLAFVSASLSAQINPISAVGSTNLQPASYAIDNNGSTRWESNHGVSPSTLTLDLGQQYALNQVVIVWEAANAERYEILGSNNNSTWTQLALRTGGTFGNRTDTVLLSGTYRYVRMNGITRSAGNNWGYSIFEIDVFGSLPPASSSSRSSSSAPASSVSGCAQGCLSTLNSNTIRATVNGGDIVDIHYNVNGGAQQNVRMNVSGGVWTYDISGLAAGATVNANFTIIKSGAGQDTAWISHTLGTTPSSSSSSSRSSSSSSSSVVANGLVRVYQDCNYGGWVANFNVGTFNTAALVAAGATDNGASSIRVAAGYRAVLYPDNNLAGTPITITADTSCLVGLNFNDVMSSMIVSQIPASSTSSSSSSTASLGNITPLYNNSTPLESVIRFDRGDALVTRISDRGRDRHAKENHFQAYDHYLTFYWEQRTAAIEIVDYVAKGGTSVRMNVVAQSKLDDLQAENRWWYIGMNTLAEYCGNGVMNRVGTTLSYWKEDSYNCRENRPIRIGDKLEFEISQFLDKAYVMRGRDNYYGTTYLYIVGQGLVPWDVTDKVAFQGGVFKQRDSIPIPVSARLGGDTSLHVQMTAEPDGHFQQMATNLGYDNGQPFVLGRRVHHTSFVDGSHDESPENGVFSEMVGKAGTRYVNDRCSRCHERNGRAPVANVGEPLDRWVFKVGNASGNPHAQLGRVLQPKANGGAASEGNVSIQFWTESNGLRSPNYQFTGVRPETFSARLAPQLVGIGLLEAIPESTILAREDVNDANGDGISGKAQRIVDPSGVTRLGRFGYKAGTTSVKHQIASAFNTDMGVMTSMLPNPDCGSSQTNCGASGSEISDTHVNNLVKYVALLGVRPQRDYNNAQVINGRTVFNNIGCAGCHVESVTTSQYHPFAELRSQAIKPYTDLLLHDMGPGLADNLGEGVATGAEWRTAPLWGLGVSACVTGGVTGTPGGVAFGLDGNEKCVPKASYLHDGRARTIEEAILWHGGEGQNANNNYKALSASQKQDLLRFLESL